MTASISLPPAIDAALAEIRQAGVCRLVDIKPYDTGWMAETVFTVALPQRDREGGVTSLGVREEEPIWFWFGSNFPIVAPEVYLRPDFPPNFPHLYAYTGPDGRRVPCVYAGNLSDLLHTGGALLPILNQTKDWLDRAARDGLYDPVNGWEPVILPDGNGTVTIDGPLLTQAVNEQIGSQAFAVEFESSDKPPCFLHNGPKRTSPPKYESLVVDGKRETSLLQVWPPKVHTSTVRSFTEVQSLEDLFDCIGARKSGLRFFTLKRLKDIASEINGVLYEKAGTVPVVLVITFRRPVRITSQVHPFEPVPFLIELPIRRPKEIDPKMVAVSLLTHRQPITAALGARLSGVPYLAEQDPIVLLGLGSLGSKIAVHLTKAGVGPLVHVDRSMFSPHVAARHEVNVLLKGRKAALTHMITERHGVASKFHAVDILDIINRRPGKSWEELEIGRARFLVETTASYQIQEALINTGALPGRLISVSFFANGQAGGLFLEGADRLPRLDDLKASLYDRAVDDEAMHALLHGLGRGLTREYVGVGCHTMTMVMSNAQASLFAASFGKQLLDYHVRAPGAHGEWLFGQSDASGLGSVWHRQLLGATYVLGRSTVDQRGWDVRVLAPVVEFVRKDTHQCAPLESGGTLYGTVNPLMRRITVTRVEPPPPDSQRSRDRFIHGTVGLRERVRHIEQRSTGLIGFLGTWHSHPKGGGASGMDRDTAHKFAELRQGGPFVMLITEPDGSVRALIEEREPS